MKLKYILVLLFSHLLSASFSQTNVVGRYERVDCNIWINSDSTFKIIYHGDMSRRWATGIWTMKKRNILFTFKPVYDTFTLKTKDGLTDSLFLSDDFNSERYDENSPKTRNLYSVMQSDKDCPKTLQLINNKLYIILNGKKLKKKIKSGFLIKPIDPFFIKKY